AGDEPGDGPQGADARAAADSVDDRAHATGGGAVGPGAAPPPRLVPGVRPGPRCDRPARRAARQRAIPHQPGGAGRQATGDAARPGAGGVLGEMTWGLGPGQAAIRRRSRPIVARTPSQPSMPSDRTDSPRLTFDAPALRFSKTIGNSPSRQPARW